MVEVYRDEEDELRYGKSAYIVFARTPGKKPRPKKVGVYDSLAIAVVKARETLKSNHRYPGIEIYKPYVLRDSVEEAEAITFEEVSDGYFVPYPILRIDREWVGESLS